MECIGIIYLTVDEQESFVGPNRFVRIASEPKDSRRDFKVGSDDGKSLGQLLIDRGVCQDCAIVVDNPRYDDLLDVESGRASKILPSQTYANHLIKIDAIIFRLGDLLSRENQPRSFGTDSLLGYFGSGDGGESGFSVQEEGIEQRNSAKERQNGLRQGESDNPIGGLVHTLLSEKVVYLTLIGFLLLPLGTLGLFWFFEDSNGNRKRFGALIAALVLPSAAALVGYGLFG